LTSRERGAGLPASGWGIAIFIPRASSVTIDDVAPMIEDGIAKAVAAIPKPVDGKDADLKDYAGKVTLIVNLASQ